MEKQDAMTINGEKTDGLDYVICRGIYSGINAGYLKNHNGNHVTLLNHRKVWQQSSDKKFSSWFCALAKRGITDGNTAVSEESPRIWLGDIYKMIPCTAEAAKTIIEAPVCEK